MTLLAVTGLSRRFGRRSVVAGVDLTVGPGEIVGLLGANGAGKTTTFRMLVGVLRPDAGQILFEGRDITRLSMDARARLGMGYLAQEPTVFAELTVADNIRLVLEHHVARPQRAARLARLLQELHLEHLAGNLAGGLSGGERRRLEITRALVMDPKLLFFDEPFAGVDPRSRADIRALTAGLRDRGISVVITDHHAEAILGMVDRLYVMDSGSMIASGTPPAIIADTVVRQRYLGEDFRMDLGAAPVVPPPTGPA